MPTVEELVQQGRLERVEPDREAAESELEMARTHLESVEAVVDDDPVLAYAAVYDGVRKAISAHMRANGLRPTPGIGNHIKMIEYAEAALGPLGVAEAVSELDRMRTTRHGSEYRVQFVGATQVRADAEHARAIANAVAGDL